MYSAENRCPSWERLSLQGSAGDSTHWVDMRQGWPRSSLGKGAKWLNSVFYPLGLIAVFPVQNRPPQRHFCICPYCSHRPSWLFSDVILKAVNAQSWLGGNPVWYFTSNDFKTNLFLSFKSSFWWNLLWNSLLLSVFTMVVFIEAFIFKEMHAAYLPNGLDND